ncbi:unnamed protein product [Rotaria sp. Silwood2]|nr:unnamed protein product [Rotaria sp. Silwood2]
MYCSKNTAHRARECMGENRLKKRTNEISELMQNEDLSVNDSNTMEYDATDNTYNITTASTACVISSLLDESLDEIESSFGDVNDEELEVESDDDDNDDIDEFIFSYDMNNQTKLFASSPLSIHEACLIIIKLARRLNLNKNDIKNFLDGIRHLFPADVKLPRTVKELVYFYVSKYEESNNFGLNK